VRGEGEWLGEWEGMGEGEGEGLGEVLEGPEHRSAGGGEIATRGHTLSPSRSPNF
jgi:hypothetical protein